MPSPLSLALKICNSPDFISPPSSAVQVRPITALSFSFCKRRRWQCLPVLPPCCEEKEKAVNTGQVFRHCRDGSQTSKLQGLSWSLCLWAQCVLRKRCVTRGGIASVHTSASDTTICCSIWGCWNLSSLLLGILQLRQKPDHKQQKN